jgi:POT family proton-dependent oligopeptide transporter
MGVLAAVAAVFFWFSVRHLDADEDKLNNLNEGHLGGEVVQESYRTKEKN